MRILILLLNIIISIQLMASDKHCYSLSSNGILIEIDEFKNEIVIQKLVINLDLIGGKTPYSLVTPYKIPILSKKISEDGWITFMGSDFSQNKGITAELEIVKTKKLLGYTVMEIVDGVTGFSYKPSLLKVTKTNKTCLMTNIHSEKLK